MKLNNSTLRGKIKTYLQSDSFQKKYAEQVKLSPYKWYWDDSDVEDVVNRLKKQIWLASEILTTRQESGASSLAHKDYRELLSHRITDVKRDPTNPKFFISCKVEVFFNPLWVHVASLYPDPVHGYPNGVDNIIRLLTNGWDYRRRQDKDPLFYSNLYRSRMHGDWRLGSFDSNNIIENVYAVSYRRGSSILFDYISNFNHEEDGVYATLSESYVGAYGIGGKGFGNHSVINSVYITGIGIIKFGTKM